MATRTTPTTGTDRQRLATAAAGKFLAEEVHTTKDHGRAWMGGTRPLTGAVYLGSVASQAAMLALFASGAKGRGCFEGDDCYRSDTLTWWKCIANNGKLIGEWQEMSAALPTVAAADVTYDPTASGLTATDVQAAIDELSASAFSGNAVDVVYDNTSSGLSATDVQAAIDELEGMISGGTGDFVGPSSSTDNAIVRFDGTTGKLGQNSVVTIDDNGNIIVGTSTPAGIGLTFQTTAYGFIQFKRSGTANASWGVAGGANDFITGSVVDDMCYRNDASKSILFSTDNGSTIALKIEASTGKVSTKNEFTALVLHSSVSASQYAVFDWITPSRNYSWALGGASTAAPDLFYLYDQTAAAVRMSINTFGLLTVNQALDIGDGTATGPRLKVNSSTAPYFQFAVGGTVKASFGAAASTNDFFTGTAAGQLVLKSDSAQGLAFSGNGSNKHMEITSAGKTIFGNSIKTSAPTSGTAAEWKLGSQQTGVALALVATQYIELDIGGTLYKLALVT